MSENDGPANGADDSLDRAISEYRQLPATNDRCFRWGFMGAWGKRTDQGVQHACMSINTTTLEGFLSTRTQEEVAEFAAIFTDPNALRICGCVFRHGGQASEQHLRDERDLDLGALNRTLQPLVSWHLVEWQGDMLVARGQGVNYAMTLTGMAIEGHKQRGHIGN